jgi:hypothetical protein
MNGSDRKVVGVNWWTGENMGGRGSRQVSEQRKSGGVFDLYLPEPSTEHAPATPFSTRPCLASPMQRIAAIRDAALPPLNLVLVVPATCNYWLFVDKPISSPLPVPHRPLFRHVSRNHPCPSASAMNAANSPHYCS